MRFLIFLVKLPLKLILIHASDRRSCMLSGLDTGRNTGHIVFDPVCTAICWYGGGSNPGRNPKQSNGIYSFVEKKERRVKNIELHT